ncbi:hypothetical protein K440DRAFT_617980 [Wilcoxina mikolae CBS 423.85]|nr:hypothetical protein K440DRAFT_617980 [Wilcoxina mikolae CBS 423.85]
MKSPTSILGTFTFLVAALSHTASASPAGPAVCVSSSRSCASNHWCAANARDQLLITFGCKHAPDDTTFLYNGGKTIAYSASGPCSASFETSLSLFIQCGGLRHTLSNIINSCPGSGRTDITDYSYTISTCGKKRRHRHVKREEPTERDREPGMVIMSRDEEVRRSILFLTRSEDDHITGDTVLLFPYSGTEDIKVCELARVEHNEELAKKFYC